MKKLFFVCTLFLCLQYSNAQTENITIEPKSKNIAYYNSLDYDALLSEKKEIISEMRAEISKLKKEVQSDLDTNTVYLYSDLEGLLSDLKAHQKVLIKQHKENQEILKNQRVDGNTIVQDAYFIMKENRNMILDIDTIVMKEYYKADSIFQNMELEANLEYDKLTKEIQEVYRIEIMELDKILTIKLRENSLIENQKLDAIK